MEINQDMKINQDMEGLVLNHVKISVEDQDIKINQYKKINRYLEVNQDV